MFIVREYWLPDVEIATVGKNPNAPVTDANASDVEDRATWRSSEIGGEEETTFADQQPSDADDGPKTKSGEQGAKVVPTLCLFLR